jgi:hypothetical protein
MAGEWSGGVVTRESAVECCGRPGQANIRQVTNIRRARAGLEEAGDFLEQKKRGFVLPNLRLMYYKAPDLDITKNDSAASRHTLSARRCIGRSASAFLNGSASLMRATSAFRSPNGTPLPGTRQSIWSPHPVGFLRAAPCCPHRGH